MIGKMKNLINGLMVITGIIIRLSWHFYFEFKSNKLPDKYENKAKLKKKSESVCIFTIYLYCGSAFKISMKVKRFLKF